MELDDIENEYRINVEKEDEAFLKNLSGATDKEKRKEVEEEYHENLKIILEKYRKKVSDFLGQKDVELFEKDKGIEEEKKKIISSSVFKVKKFDFKRSYFERLRIWWKVFKFRFGINIKSFIYRITPSSLIIFFFEIKLIFISFYLDSRFFLRSAFLWVSKKIANVINAIKNFFLKVYTFFKKILSAIFHKFLPSKDKEAKKEGSQKDKPKLKPKA